MLDLFAGGILHLGEVDGLDLDVVGAEKDDPAIVCHGECSSVAEWP